MYDPEASLPPPGIPLSSSIERQIAAAFQRHLTQTGEPESFPRVEIGRSESDKFQLVYEFQLDRRHRGEKSEVPCSICTGHKPKFLQGWLAYFPKDRKFRLVGNTCGPKHFGDFKQQKSDLRRRQRTEERRQFLRDNIEIAQLISDRLGEVRNSASMCDKFVAAVERQAPSLYQALKISAARTPATYLVEKTEITSVDLDSERTRTEKRAVSSKIRFFGWELFNARSNCVESFNSANRFLNEEYIANARNILGRSDDVTIDFPSKWRTSRRTLADIERQSEALVQLLSPQGISNFTEWMARDDNPVQGSVRFENCKLEVSFNKLPRERLDIQIPRSMLVRLPELPSFI